MDRTIVEKRKKSIGRWIKCLRVRKRFSQKVLAMRAGLSQNYVCLLEKGKRVPSYWALEKISRVLEVPPEALLGKSSPRQYLSSKPLLSEKDVERVRKIMKLVKAIDAKDIGRLPSK